MQLTLSPKVKVELTAADLPGFLQYLTDSGIALESLELTGALTATFIVQKNVMRPLRQMAVKHGVSLKIIERHGLYWTLMGVKNRPVLLFGLCFLVVIQLYLPTRVLFLRVEGNANIPERMILEHAAANGIGFFASRRDVRSERMKNALLESMPQLQWAGINTKGCTAVISVRERSTVTADETQRGVSRIVAVRDGIVDSCTVTKGSALCEPGQAVLEGQVLISGYTDCGLSILATRAEGEVYARTVHEICAVSPINYMRKGAKTVSSRKFSLLIGKKRINLYKDSGISPISCDKMYSEYYVTLPGGFQLPYALRIERVMFYDTASMPTSADFMEQLLRSSADCYIKQEMVSGRILASTVSLDAQEDAIILSGDYICLEMIGREQSEEILQHYGKDN